MGEFVGRHAELNTLEKEYARESSSLVVLYGRLRVGKTRLISEFKKRHGNSLYFLATEESEAQNLKAFKELVADFTGNVLLKTADADWALVFKLLASHKTETKKIIVMDEFQYIGHRNPSFPSEMQKIWDTVLQDANVMLILSGSIVSMMRAQILDYDSPLYGRKTSRIKLKQIEFKHFGEFFNGEKPSMELLPYYAITGGVPKYIEIFKPYANIYEAIEQTVLSHDSFLCEEPFFLLQREVSEIGTYFSLIKAIASGNSRLSDIAEVADMQATSLTKYLKVLTDLNLVKREVPATEDNPESSKSGQYSITDNYLTFWFRFIYPYRANLEQGETALVLERIKTDFMKSYVPLVYEQVCHETMWELSRQEKFKFLFNKLGSHWGKKIEDTGIVAVDSIGKNIIVGCCEYATEPKGLSVLRELESKVDALKELTGSKGAQFVIFSPSGFTQELIEEAMESQDVVLVEGF
ncbi:MAG: ATP-binding protein [Firmicutes bacterium]|nr:ATP-binding protein [Bacillota bacterium]